MVEKNGGLNLADWAELNKGGSNSPGEKEARVSRVAVLREQYSNDPRAQRQIDVFDPNSEYAQIFHQYRDALVHGDQVKIVEFEKWLVDNGYEGA
jgi:hypothetical protein